jgi:5-methylcytosine-specific restriction enzyme A
VKPFAKKFYKSSAWKKCRATYIKSVFGICEHCGDNGYIVDHIIELNLININDPNISLNHENLQYLCTPCHNKKTFGKTEVIRKDVMFDDNGDLVKIHPPGY